VTSPAESTVKPTVEDVLRAAVGSVGGEDRPGQVQMALAVRAAMESGEHLLVQAGTGTGKSLAYLVPALLHDDRVVVATATLALQHQLVERDIPALLKAAAEVLGEHPKYAVLKGRSNYACLHRIREGVPDDQGTLIDLPEPATAAGGEVVRLRKWAEKQAKAGGPGDRDSAPSHTDRVWRQVSVNHRECLGAAKCPYGTACFAERARDRAMQASLIVTNHSLLAIDAIEGVPMIPDYNVVVVDEAHELVARVTQAETDELSLPFVDRAARRARNFVEGSAPDDLADAADVLRAMLDDQQPGRFDALPETVADAIGMVRDAARAVMSGFPREAGDGEADAARQQARGMVEEVRKTADRIAANSADDVVWLAERDPGRGGSLLCVAPLQVWGPLRDRLLSQKTVICTSATLKLGGDFTSIATSIGLRAAERADGPARVRSVAGTDDDGGAGALRWRGIDVGSPFDYSRQAILYVARSLPTPGREGIGPAQIEEIRALVEAAGGRTLGLFSSRRAAEAAAEALRAALPHLPILCQGDGQLSHLRAEFVANPAVSLFGTLSLWQGLDVPGVTCQLVIIDRIPFPRPDDPLMSARVLAADREGRNGFMSVSATHAALLLAQGAGRLIRTRQDRGVVAVLDPRLATARYGTFLRASLPPMWLTYDGETARSALRRLASIPVERTVAEP
jgi:ATP-dependent DNA helicase DinG